MHQGKTEFVDSVSVSDEESLHCKVFGEDHEESPIRKNQKLGLEGEEGPDYNRTSMIPKINFDDIVVKVQPFEQGEEAQTQDMSDDSLRVKNSVKEEGSQCLNGSSGKDKGKVKNGEGRRWPKDSLDTETARKPTVVKTTACFQAEDTNWFPINLSRDSCMLRASSKATKSKATALIRRQCHSAEKALTGHQETYREDIESVARAKRVFQQCDKRDDTACGADGSGRRKGGSELTKALCLAFGFSEEYVLTVVKCYKHHLPSIRKALMRTALNQLLK